MAILVIVAALFISACGSSATAQEPTATLPPVINSSGVIAEGRVEPVRYVEIGFNASGLVSEVLVEEGAEVQAGQVIARIDANEARTLEDAQAAAATELAEASEAVRLAQTKLDDFDIPTDLRPRTPAEAVSLTYEKLEKARQDYEPYKYLNQRRETGEFREDCPIKNGIETCKNTATYYEKALDDAWADYHKAIQWLERAAALEDAKARLAKAEKNYNDLFDTSNPEGTAGTRAALADAELSAPFAGTVARLDVKVSEPATVGEPVVTVADFSKWIIKTTDLTEVDVINVKQGGPVTISLDALPDVMLTGTVESISQTFSEKQGDIVYEVTIVLNDTNPELRWGMTAEVKFQP